MNQRVLVVHNSADAASAEVANYYVSRRAIPAGNRCVISSTSTNKLTWDEYDAKVRQPVRACLNAVGRSRILYIVFSFQTPYRVSVPDALTYALDQYVADIWDDYALQHADPSPAAPHPYYADAQSEGGSYPRFESLADWRARPGAPVIYSVWRLDAANAGVAKGLVDKAMLAEAGGLAGRACLDRRFGAIERAYDAGYGSGDWDIRRAADFARLAGFTVDEDEAGAEFGTAPAPSRCDAAALYAGWYSYNNYNDAFTWRPGAVGIHIDSASAADPRGGTNWSANALLKGITVTSGAVAEPFLDGMPHPDVVFRSLLEGANTGDAMLRGTAWLKWMIVNIGDPLYRPFPGGRPPFHTQPAEATLVLEHTGVVGPATVAGTVQLKSPAPASGTVVPLASSRTEAEVPASVTVLAGQRTATFPITVGIVNANIALKINASTPSGPLSNTLSVFPLLGSISFQPASTSAGLPLNGALWLNHQAGAGGITVQLESSNPSIASVPASLRIAAGIVIAAVTVRTVPVTTRTVVTITARLGGAAVTTNIAVEPAIAGLLVSGASATGTERTLRVILADPAAAGTSVLLTSSNPGVVSAPATTAVPTRATSVTIAITNGMTAGSSTITARYRGDSKTVTATTVLPVLYSVSLPGTVLGGNPVTGTATLTGVSPSGTVVRLSSNHAAANPPASVTVPAGSSAVTFQAPTSAVAEPASVTITATAGVSRTDTFVVNPPALSALRIADGSLSGGTSGSCTVTLTGNAPAGGARVTVASTNSAAQVPTSVTVPAGAKTATFPFATRAVSSPVSGQISTTFRGVTKSVNLTVSP